MQRLSIIRIFQGSRPWEKSYPWRNLRLPHHSPRERSKSWRVERKIKSSNLKASTPSWISKNLIRANLPHSWRVDNAHKPIKRFLLPILRWTTKSNIPMNPSTRPPHNLCHWSIPCPTKIVKFWKNLFEGTIRTPHMLPKLHYSTITHLIP